MDELRDKVRMGLLCCTKQDGDGYPFCERCPYTEKPFETCQSLNALLRDAIEALKPKEPRLLTREELLTGWGHGWEEAWLIGDDEDPERFDVEECVWIDGHVMVKSGSDAHAMSEYWQERYNKMHGVRVWEGDEPPTEETRRETPWDA